MSDKQDKPPSKEQDSANEGFAGKVGKSGDENKAAPNISIGGNVSGQAVNIGGTQTIHGNLSIKVGAMPAASEDVRETLQKQIAEILAELEKAPKEKTDDVQAVKMAVEDAVAEAEKPQPDKKRLEIRGESLKKAAENLLSVAPFVLQIATQIVATLAKIGG